MSESFKKIFLNSQTHFSKESISDNNNNLTISDNNNLTNNLMNETKYVNLNIIEFTKEDNSLNDYYENFYN